jgi:hypothetical protein
VLWSDYFNLAFIWTLNCLDQLFGLAEDVTDCPSRLNQVGGQLTQYFLCGFDHYWFWLDGWLWGDWLQRLLLWLSFGFFGLVWNLLKVVIGVAFFLNSIIVRNSFSLFLYLFQIKFRQFRRCQGLTARQFTAHYLFDDFRLTTVISLVIILVEA